MHIWVYEMYVNEIVVMSCDQRSSLCHPTNLLLLLLVIQIFQEQQLNSRIFQWRTQGANPVMPSPIQSDSMAINCERLGLLSGVFFVFALNKTLA